MCADIYRHVRAKTPWTVTAEGKIWLARSRLNDAELSPYSVGPYKVVSGIGKAGEFKDIIKFSKRDVHHFVSNVAWVTKPGITHPDLKDYHYDARAATTASKLLRFFFAFYNLFFLDQSHTSIPTTKMSGIYSQV